jgi:hypothetical protein
VFNNSLLGQVFCIDLLGRHAGAVTERLTRIA